MKGKKLLFLFIFLLIIPLAGSHVVAFTNPEVNNVTPTAIKLSVSTRHDAILYNKMGAAFAASPLAAAVGITSASEISFSGPSTFDGWFKEMTNPFFEKSVGWGGGPTLFNNLADKGALSPITDPDLVALIAANISDTIAGADMKQYDANGDLIWVGSAISSFGFTVNNAELEARGLPKPLTWEDLAAPEFFTFDSQFNIGLGNAPDTTSNTRIYQILLQKFGWEKGWELIYRMAGNGKIYGGSVETRQSVISGETAVAMTIDFYGVIAMNENPNTEYIVPQNASIVNADPIALAQNPKHPAAANAFIQYVLSPEGQAVLFDPRINRLPIRADAFLEPEGIARPDLKNLYDLTLSNQAINFDEDLAASQYSTMRFHFEYTIQDVHTKLRDTWSNLVSALKGGSFLTAPRERFEQLAAEFGQPAINQSDAIAFEADISDAGFKLAKQTEWNQFSNNKFDSVIDHLDDPYTIAVTEVTTSEIVITTTDITGGTSLVTTETVITTTSEVVQTTIISVSETTTNIPVITMWLFIGLYTPILIIKQFNKRKKLS
ncbi:MAG: ABC transporter substrate-binding protein [Candidatus Heimdallarchaeota archaeon]|nr:ABC transporter substrate-binding protein [Candidatus Heimdallarchaeota archaeon]